MKVQRFYPSISSVAAHFMDSRYRATALGIAAAGSSAGGIVFPIMLRRLFAEVGFPNAVRISGFLCLFCCGISALTITSARPPSPTRFELKDYVNCLKDSRYLLLLVGSALISFGMVPASSHSILKLTPQQAFISLFFTLSTLCESGLTAPDPPRTPFPRTF